jgi:hypothetical protein
VRPFSGCPVCLEHRPIGLGRQGDGDSQPAVEAGGTGGAHHLVPVSLGLFDDADGLVQVTGSGLSAGQQIVVPAL